LRCTEQQLLLLLLLPLQQQQRPQKQASLGYFRLWSQQAAEDPLFEAKVRRLHAPKNSRPFNCRKTPNQRSRYNKSEIWFKRAAEAEITIFLVSV